MNEVPRTWATRPFGELNGFYGANIDPASYPTERFELYSIPVFPTGKPEQPLGSEVGSTKQVVAHNDVLISKINPRINRVWQVGLPTGLRQIASSEWIGFRCTQMDARYFRYYFTSPTFRDLLCSDVTGVGGSLTRAQPKRVASFPVPVAPVNEQKRIADKLDTVLTRVDAVNTRLARVAPLLKRFRQSVLAAATSGRLVGAVKQDASKFIPVVLSDSQRSLLPDSWSWRPFTELARLESGHTPRKSVPEYWDGGSVPWLSLQDIRAADGRVIFETKLKPTMLGIDNSSARLLPAGTVCFCRDISFGYVTIMGREMATSQHFVNWVCGAELNPRYLMLALMTARDALSMSGQGTTVTTMYMPALKVLQLATPPIEIQTEIVRSVETLFAFADRLEARLQAAQTAANRLTPALLAKAFRGELVPQDPNDEPAAELLKRLTDSESTPVKRRGRSPVSL